ncbi:MAG: hypothetical protein DWG76_06645 [Chloroflexi bacterium]|nr:hypothetical protein [Chloroflexota bacterium]
MKWKQALIKWLWIVVIGFLWPLLFFIYGGMRFGFDNPDTGFWQAFRDFGLLGLLSGWLLFWFMERAKTTKQRWGNLLGYVIFAPVGLVFALGGGLFLGFVGAAILGSTMLALGAWLGGRVGARLNR